MARPRATYRMQLHRDFPFAAARARVPYLARLGISHLYVSPILTARSGSMHGYDIVDHGAVNPELGGEPELLALVAELRRHDMGLIVDIVPNHMAVGNADNALWLDVLEWGHNSRYANFFDIDWDVADPLLKNKLLAPFLGKQYGEALNDGDIALQFDTSTGKFFAQYYEHRFPIAPTTYPQLLRLGGAALAAAAKQFREATTQRLNRRGDIFFDTCKQLAQQRLDNADIAQALDDLLQRFDAHSESGRQLLHQLLKRQHYRLAYWRTAADEINWRRFFDVIQLAGIRIQEPSAFAIVHATIFRLYAEGLIDGVRIDHIDGLADPRAYCRRLRKRLNQLARQRPAAAPGGPAYFVVEKILAPEERLPGEWQIDGTTGYSFMNEVSALLHDPAGEKILADMWAGLSGRVADFTIESRTARRRILHELLAAEFGACALALHRIARADIRTRDWSLAAIRRTLEELLVQFPVYRTYADARGRSAADDTVMRDSIDAARPHCRPADQPLFDLLDRWLGGEPPITAQQRGRQLRLRAIARFQQLSSPLAAKSVEDTAFYRHGKLLSRNEVGANPAQFANSPQDFHAECQRRAQFFPHALLATATHDHKRGEDFRARLAVLSEIPQLWSARTAAWLVRNGQLKSARDTPLPADEYMLYQMLVGGWPPDLSSAGWPTDLREADSAGLRTISERLQQWWIKALREAKQRSSWSDPHEDYEQACCEHVRKLLDPQLSATFIGEVIDFVAIIDPAAKLNSLAQTVLKLTAPGIADIYQGCELWDFSFVDPDNRRPVDFDRRERLLSAADPESREEYWRDGGIKQNVIAKLLAWRRTHEDLFANGAYLPLPVRGLLADHVFAFARIKGNDVLLVAVPRLAYGLEPGGPSPRSARKRNDLLRVQPTLAHVDWRDTAIDLSPMTDLEIALPRQWRTLSDDMFFFDNKMFSGDKTYFSCADLFHERPFSVLMSI